MRWQSEKAQTAAAGTRVSLHGIEAVLMQRLLMTRRTRRTPLDLGFYCLAPCLDYSG